MLLLSNCAIATFGLCIIGVAEASAATRVASWRGIWSACCPAMGQETTKGVGWRDGYMECMGHMPQFLLIVVMLGTNSKNDPSKLEPRGLASPNDLDR